MRKGRNAGPSGSRDLRPRNKTPRGCPRGTESAARRLPAFRKNAPRGYRAENRNAGPSGSTRPSVLKQAPAVARRAPKAPQGDFRPSKTKRPRAVYPGGACRIRRLRTYDQRAKSSRAPQGFLRVIVRVLLIRSMVSNVPYGGRQVKRLQTPFPRPGVTPVTPSCAFTRISKQRWMRGLRSKSCGSVLVEMSTTS